MDGTLLDGRGAIPETLWPLLERMERRGILFAPASGRQYATLAQMFGARPGMPFIAENGTFVVRDGEALSASVIDPGYVARTVALLRGLARAGRDIGTVLCGTRTAYIERPDEPFREIVAPYYRSNEVVDDLLGVDEDIIKIAVYDFDQAEAGTYPALVAAAEGHRIVLSTAHWLDVSNADATKGRALAAIQHELGIGACQTAVFGDYLNDLDMFDHAGLSFAMANAHPDLIARARFLAPANTEHGVITTVTRLLDTNGTGDEDGS
ncbi:HAD-IIB family hydrolase [Acidipropionibacterium virtanenii]|nr:HAD-IIB family hydrolase [Acidipropionibacterium virtanenii]